MRHEKQASAFERQHAQKVQHREDAMKHQEEVHKLKKSVKKLMKAGVVTTNESPSPRASPRARSRAKGEGFSRRDSSDMGGSEPASSVLAEAGSENTEAASDNVTADSRSPPLNVRTREKVFRRARLDNTTPTTDDESGARLPPHPRANRSGSSGVNSGAESPSVPTNSTGKVGRHLPRTASGVEAHHVVCWTTPTLPAPPSPIPPLYSLTAPLQTPLRLVTYK